jgi:hypothetical protein
MDSMFRHLRLRSRRNVQLALEVLEERNPPVGLPFATALGAVLADQLHTPPHIRYAASGS